jgi:5-methylcytosine-specific restriction endonuclease McrA
MPTLPKSNRPPWMPERKAWDQVRTREEVDIYRNVYNTPRWRAVRDAKRMANPICEMCKREPVHTIDHKRPIRAGGDPWDTDNIQSLCKGCNASKTGKQGKGGVPNKL